MIKYLIGGRYGRGVDVGEAFVVWVFMQSALSACARAHDRNKTYGKDINHRRRYN